MSWCDKLSSTACVGFRLDTHFASSDQIIDRLSPMLDKLVDNHRQLFSIDAVEPTAVTLTTHDGTHYGIDASKVYVEFQHQLRARSVSGGLPVMEMVSRPLPYSELVREMADKAIEATLLIAAKTSRKITQVGVIARTKVAEDELPPGIKRFIQYVGRPWNGRIDSYNFHLTTQLNEGTESVDRCIHNLTKSELDFDHLVNLQFDWQRKFASGKVVTQASLKEIYSSAEKAALTYFEELAEGSGFDEEIIRTSIGARTS